MILIPVNTFLKDTMASSPRGSVLEGRNKVLELRHRLSQCWKQDINWDLYPEEIVKVRIVKSTKFNVLLVLYNVILLCILQGCHTIANSISMPASAVLAGVITAVSFVMSNSVVEVEDKEWIEPVILWNLICMPTGSGKSSLCKFLRKILDMARANCGMNEQSPTWFIDDQSFEKMGSMMADNG